MENIDLTKRLTPTHLTARLADEGDHWQSGNFFLPFVSLDAANQAAQRAQMEASLETENVIAEVLDNEQNAVFGREPDWQIIDPSATVEKPSRLVEEAEAAAVDYWNDFNLINVPKQGSRRAAAQGKSFIRAYVPKGLLTGINNRKANTREAMNLIRFEVLSADKGGVFFNEETHEHYGLHKKYTKAGEQYTELTYIENGKTIVKAIKSTNYAQLADETLAVLKAYMPDDKTTVDVAAYDLGGELLYFEIDRKPLITESIISNQKDVNLCLTMKNRLTYQAAYRDFFFFNTKEPVDKDDKPTSIKTGGRAANFLAGEDVVDPLTKNVTAYANGSLTVIEPSSSENIIKSKEASAFAIYNQCSQVHLTKNESANISGASKRESRFSFEKKCLENAQTMNGLGRWMIKVLVLFAADNMKTSEDYKDFRFDFNCRIDAGAPDAEEIRQAMDACEKGFISEETLLSKYFRFDDADAETARLRSSESYSLALWNKRLQAAKEARDLGLPAAEWIQVIYPDDEAKQAEVLMQLGTTPPPRQLEAGV